VKRELGFEGIKGWEKEKERAFFFWGEDWTAMEKGD
jgi:hypothetical protein